MSLVKVVNELQHQDAKGTIFEELPGAVTDRSGSSQHPKRVRKPFGDVSAWGAGGHVISRFSSDKRRCLGGVRRAFPWDLLFTFCQRALVFNQSAL
jgi:hypothetical protein